MSDWEPYVPVAKRRSQAQRKLAAQAKKGKLMQPVVIAGRSIATTFWGKQWCENLESYSDYASRLERGRSYVRNGAVLDLQIAKGHVSAQVLCSAMFQVDIRVLELDAAHWRAIQSACAGQLTSLVELLQGKFSNAVMEIVARQRSGLFPTPSQIDFSCSCPDWAMMCKHVAASLYGVGARLDNQPELMFLLRGVDPLELIGQSGNLQILGNQAEPMLADSDLSALFGIEIHDAASPLVAPLMDAAVRPAPDSTLLRVTQQATSRPQSEARDTINTERGQRLSAAELLAYGIPRSTQQYWLKAGILLRSEQRGVYLATGMTRKYINSYLHDQ